MFLYIVLDSEDRTVNSIWDAENFKKQYPYYLDSSGFYWDRSYDIVKCELNKNYSNNNWEYVDPMDVKNV